MGATEGFLKTVTLFNTLNDGEITLLSALVKSVEYQAGAAIVHEGESSEDFYIVQSGFVNVMRHDETDKEVFLTTLKAGEYFGEAALFHDVKRSADVVAAEAVRVLTISRKNFEGFLNANPLASNRILHVMLRLVFERLAKTSGDLTARRKSNMSQSAIDRLFI